LEFGIEVGLRKERKIGSLRERKREREREMDGLWRKRVEGFNGEHEWPENPGSL